MPFCPVTVEQVESKYMQLSIHCRSNFYRPQTKFVKVMFLQVSVCPQEGGLCLSPGRVSILGGLCPGGLCPGVLCSGGSLSRQGVSVPGRGSLSRQGVSVQAGGLCLGRGSLSKGVSVWEGLCPGGGLCQRPPVR